MESDITKNIYTYGGPYGNEEWDIRLALETYSDNGTLAITMNALLGQGEQQAEEPYGCLTVNLPPSDTLPLNIQFVDENNFPGIGDWLEEHGIASPTDRFTRSGWCLYPAYEFHLNPMQMGEVLERRIAEAPSQTLNTLSAQMSDLIEDTKDGFSRLMTLEEIKAYHRSLPEGLRGKIGLPDTLRFKDGTGIDWKAVEMMKFTAPLPDRLPAMDFNGAMEKFRTRKERTVSGDSPREFINIPEGSMVRIGEIKMNMVSKGFPVEYSNPFLVEIRNTRGRLMEEYFAIDNSYADNLKAGPCIGHLANGMTAFSVWSADRTSDNCIRGNECLYSPKGSLIGMNWGDLDFGKENIRLSPEYKEAVKYCIEDLKGQLDNVKTEFVSTLQGMIPEKERGMKI